MSEPLTCATLLERRVKDRLNRLDPSTVKHYQRCSRQYGEFLGRAPLADDLNADSLIDWLEHMRDVQSIRITTANARLKQLRALWSWSHHEGYVSKGPPRRFKLQEERPIPDSWTGEELQKLFDAAKTFGGWIGPHRTSDFMTALLWLAFNTGERAGAIWAMTPGMVDLNAGTLEVPAEVRKGERVAMRWVLSPRCIDALDIIIQRSDHMLFDRTWQYDSSWSRYSKRLVTAAGLKYDRRQGLQKMRRTVASWIKIRGGDPSVWLGHAPKTVAAAHYVDRWATQQMQRHIWPIDELSPTAGMEQYLTPPAG